MSGWCGGISPTRPNSGDRRAGNRRLKNRLLLGREAGNEGWVGLTRPRQGVAWRRGSRCLECRRLRGPRNWFPITCSDIGYESSPWAGIETWSFPTTCANPTTGSPAPPAAASTTTVTAAAPGWSGYSTGTRPVSVPRGPLMPPPSAVTPASSDRGRTAAPNYSRPSIIVSLWASSTVARQGWAASSTHPSATGMTGAVSAFTAAPSAPTISV